MSSGDIGDTNEATTLILVTFARESATDAILAVHILCGRNELDSVTRCCHRRLLSVIPLRGVTSDATSSLILFLGGRPQWRCTGLRGPDLPVATGSKPLWRVGHSGPGASSEHTRPRP
jgi:hypothetical protein